MPPRWHLEFFASATPEPGPGQYRCEMCGLVYDLEDDEKAQAEREANGLADVDCGVVCDDCYRLTPWGREEE